MGECQPLDNPLSHVPDVGERRIVQTAPGIEKGWSPEGPGPVLTYSDSTRKIGEKLGVSHTQVKRMLSG
jgi:hypothetical protein